MELIPNNPRDALKWYEKHLKEARKINANAVRDGYDPLGGMTSLIFNYLKNIRSLKARIKEAGQ